MFWDILKMSFEALWSNKIRSILSVIGIIIGVSTVIVVVGIGSGAKKQIEEQYKNLSVNTIMIMQQMGRKAITKSKLSDTDAQVISQKVENIGQTTAFIRSNTDASYGKESTSVGTFGVDGNFFEITNLNLSAGRLITNEDENSKARIAVLGSGTVNSLFGEDVEDNDVVGKNFVINGKKINIVGVLKENGSGAMGGRMSYDDAIYAPYSTAESILLGKNNGVSIIVLMNGVSQLKKGMEDIRIVLRGEHNLKDKDQDDFRMFDAGSMVGAAQDSTNTMSLLLVSVATIVLIVSGVGIMNVMFVTVAERTKEIGIAKAIGAQKQLILMQFLMESVTLSIGGGLIGVVLGQIIIPILNRFDGWYVVPSLQGVVLSFTFSALVGLFFGFYPAYKGSNLDPVDALRSE